ncbi:MAG: diguanylate cyclase, partial [Arenimonas sp.]
LAAQLCQTPISTVTLVDKDRQWFKARVGIDSRQTPRGIAFCAHTILHVEPMIIPNALLDSRFENNPLVLGPPHIIFYAGFPLISTDGSAIGTLTAMDNVPRTLAPEQIFAMKVLADQVVAQLELRRSLHELSATHADLLQTKLQLDVRIEERTKDLAQANVAHAHAELLYHSLWETTTDAIIVMDTQNIIHYANPSTERVFGHRLERVIGNSLAQLQPARLRHAHQHGLKSYLDTGWKQLDWRAVETSGLHADGSEIPIEISFTEIMQDERRLFVGFIRDISERKRIEAALLEEKERAQITLRSIGDGVITTDPDGLIVFLNPMAEQLTGWLNEDAYESHSDEVLKLSDEITGNPITIASVLIGYASQTPGAMPPTTLLEHRVDREKVSIEGSVVKMFGRQDEFAGWVIAFRDVSLSRQLVAKLSYQASHDPLTGLVNRTEFDRRLRKALESTATLKRHHSMLYMDLDQFKVVNDTRGHIAGDELLKQLCSLLLQGLRASDTLARLGGDEFGILLENCESEAALQIAEKLRQVVANFTFIWEAQAYSTTVSIGHVHFNDSSLSLADILSKADEACYMAKEKGRNRVHTFQPSDEVLAQRHGEMEWVRLIREAREEARLVLYFQKIYDVCDTAQQASHVEILLRMRDRDGQLVPPM